MCLCFFSFSSDPRFYLFFQATFPFQTTYFSSCELIASHPSLSLFLFLLPIRAVLHSRRSCVTRKPTNPCGSATCTGASFGLPFCSTYFVVGLLLPHVLQPQCCLPCIALDVVYALCAECCVWCSHKPVHVCSLCSFDLFIYFPFIFSSRLPFFLLVTFLIRLFLSILFYPS